MSTFHINQDQQLFTNTSRVLIKFLANFTREKLNVNKIWSQPQRFLAFIGDTGKTHCWWSAGIQSHSSVSYHTGAVQDRFFFFFFFSHWQALTQTNTVLPLHQTSHNTFHHILSEVGIAVTDGFTNNLSLGNIFYYKALGPCSNQSKAVKFNIQR